MLHAAASRAAPAQPHQAPPPHLTTPCLHRSSTAHSNPAPPCSAPAPPPRQSPLRSCPSHYPPSIFTAVHRRFTTHCLAGTLASQCRPSGSPIRSFSRRSSGSSGSKPSFPILYLIACFLGFRISRCLLLLFINPIYSNVQRVGVSEVTLAVVSQLGAKLASTDRGQASEVTVGS